jgi:hypothetical protein
MVAAHLQIPQACRIMTIGHHVCPFPVTQNIYKLGNKNIAFKILL